MGQLDSALRSGVSVLETARMFAQRKSAVQNHKRHMNGTAKRAAAVDTSPQPTNGSAGLAVLDASNHAAPVSVTPPPESESQSDALTSPAPAEAPGKGGQNDPLINPPLTVPRLETIDAARQSRESGFAGELAPLNRACDERYLVLRSANHRPHIFDSLGQFPVRTNQPSPPALRPMQSHLP